MPRLVGEKLVKKLTKRDGQTEHIDNLGIIEVQFAKSFVKVPKLFVNLDGDANFEIQNKTKFGFKVRFKDADFSPSNYTGEFDWEAVPEDALEV